MISILLRAGTRKLYYLQLILAGYFLLRGHNLPGGGFIAGLVAASAFALWAQAFDVAQAKKRLCFSPESIIAFGLLIAIFSGLISLFRDQPFMQAIWIGSVPLPVVGSVSVGTPFIFDIGVFFVVLGAASAILFSIFKLGERDTNRGENP